MTQQTIGVGAFPNDTTGDPLLTAFQKVNANFTELYVPVARTAAEIAAGVTPTNFGYPVGLVDRYGTNTSPGVTPMSAAINAAIAVANAAGGGKVSYLGTSYLVDTPISYVFSNIIHEGTSTESTVIVNGTANAPAFTIGNNVTQLYGGGIAKMRFTGKTAVTGVAGQTAFTIQKLGQFRIEDVFVSNAISALYRGAYFVNCSQWVTFNLEVQNCTLDGITNIGGTDAYVTDCRSDANGGAGWVLNNAQGCFYKGCTAYNNSGTAWSLASTTPAVAPNFNNFFMECIGDTSGSYNWSINDSIDSYWIGCWGATQQSSAVNTFATGFVIFSVNSRHLFFTGCVAIFNNSHGFQVFDTGASAPVNIHFTNCQGGSPGVTGPNGNGRSGSGYGISINGVCTQIRVIGGSYLSNTSGAIQNATTGTQDVTIDNPVGFVSCSQGTGTIAIAATSVVITHGLGFTPTLSNIQLTDTSSMAASAITSRWISAVAATTFTVTSNAAVAGATYNFGWRASYNGT